MSTYVTESINLFLVFLLDLSNVILLMIAEDPLKNHLEIIPKSQKDIKSLSQHDEGANSFTVFL